MEISDIAKRRSMLIQQLGAPAIHVNCFYIMEVDDGYRFTMMESLGSDSPDVPRNAFWMTTTNAEAMYKMLSQHLYGKTDELGNSIPEATQGERVDPTLAELGEQTDNHDYDQP
jgi:hypothetical protein